MPSRRQSSPSFEMANCFQSLQCLSGHPPPECSSNSKLICPVLPLSNNQNNNMSFSPPNSNGIMTSSDDSEEDSNYPNSYQQQQRQHNTLAKTPIAFPSNQTTTTSPSSTTPSTSPTLSTAPAPAPRPQMRPHRRIPHTIIERRYRDNLNTSIETLRLCLPTLKDAYITSPDMEDSALPPKLPSKTIIIATAAGYIKELEGERDAVRGEMEGLRNQVVELRKLVMCGECGILQYLQEVGGNAGDGDGGMTGV
ncbi:unnamed protein product [Zymoseptoria tritici ST99CH_1A5]|uniref:BHLH domain-containing protein n=1 Tax=Zymoseptoria tritici ST99CH_1A5 TaxID=1276529 RepID=A0A1Y6LX29_ZYMTR|nr:unnamed protein product [Zymoseptoria tritici ST99CH_1A5]